MKNKQVYIYGTSSTLLARLSQFMTTAFFMGMASSKEQEFTTDVHLLCRVSESFHGNSEVIQGLIGSLGPDVRLAATPRS